MNTIVNNNINQRDKKTSITVNTSWHLFYFCIRWLSFWLVFTAEPVVVASKRDWRYIFVNFRIEFTQ
jgi:hypothetical protein